MASERRVGGRSRLEEEDWEFALMERWEVTLASG